MLATRASALPTLHTHTLFVHQSMCAAALITRPPAHQASKWKHVSAELPVTDLARGVTFSGNGPLCNVSPAESRRVRVQGGGVSISSERNKQSSGTLSPGFSVMLPTGRI